MKYSGKKKAHQHKLFGPVGCGTTPGLSQGQTHVFSLSYTLEAQFVPGTNWVCPRDKPGAKGGRKSFCAKSYCGIQIDYRQRLFLGEMHFQLQIQNHAATGTSFHYRDRSLGISAEKSHYRYRFSLEFQLIAITDTDFGLKLN